MKKINNILLIVLFTLTLLLALPVSTVSASENATSGVTGDCTWTLDGTVLTISGNGPMGSYFYEDYPWGTSITEVIIESGVTKIGEYSFRDCSNLTRVAIPDSVTDIGALAFYNCSSLTNIIIPDGVISIGDMAFSHCRSLNSVMIPNSMTSISERLFAACSSLTSVTIGDGVTSIGRGAFADCNNLRSISIPDSITDIGDEAFRACSSLKYNVFDNAKYLGNERNPYVVLVQSLSPDIVNCAIHVDTKIINHYAFRGCDRLTEVFIPEKVIFIGSYAFHECANLAGIWVDANNLAYCSDEFGVLFNKSKTQLIQAHNAISGCYEIPNGVEVIGNNAFYSCHRLTGVTIPNSVTSIGSFAFCGSGLMSVSVPEGVISIGGRAFQYCRDLISITLPDSMIRIGSEAFRNCTSLTSITVPCGVTDIGTGLFSECSSLGGIWVDESNPSYSSDASGVLFDKKKTHLIQAPGGLSGDYVIPGSVVTIASQAFLACDSLTKVVIPDSVTRIDSQAFYRCGSLTDVTLSNGLTSISWFVFGSCRSLTSVTIPDSVTIIDDWAFDGCSRLTTVKIGSSVKSIGVGAFASCDSLVGIWVDKENNRYSSDASGVLYSKDKTRLLQAPAAIMEYNIPAGVTFIEDSAFSGCENLISVIIPNSVIGIGSYAFHSCGSLTSIAIPDSVTSIGSDAFSYCSSLTSITIPDSVESIQYQMFSGCESLTSVKLPDGITYIGTSSFYNCRSLTSIIIPDSVTQIDYCAFAFCSGLESVIIPNKVEEIGEGVFSGSGLTSISLPASLKKIDYRAFESGVQHVAYAGTEEQWNAISLGDRNTGLTDAEYFHYEAEIAWKKNCINSGLFCSACNDFVTRESEENGTHSYTDNMDLHCNDCDYVRTANVISVSQMPNILEYVLFEGSLDVTGGVLSVIYSDGTSGTVEMTLDMVTDFDNAILGPQRLTVTYCGAVTSYMVETVASDPETLALDVLPDKLCYLVETSVELSGISLTATYANGQSVMLDAEDVTVDAMDMSTAGTKTVTVRFKNSFVTYEIYVHDKLSQTVDSSLYPESDHNYAGNIDETKTLTVDGAENLVLTFSSESYTEHNYDFVHILDGAGNEIGKYSGSLSGKVVTVPGNTVQIRLTTDGSVFKYGYAFTSITAESMLHPQQEVPATATCTQPGLTAGTVCQICGVTLSGREQVDNLEHDYTCVVTKAPTFTAEGQQEMTCNDCGHYVSEVIPVAVGKVEKWNITLGNAILVNLHLNISQSIEPTAKVKVTVGDTTVTYSAADLARTEDGLYIVSAQIAAAQMADDIIVMVMNKNAVGDFSNYTVRQYAETVLGDERYSQYHGLIREMLSYGGAAQIYFDYGTDCLASDGITDTAVEEVPAETENFCVSGSMENASFYAASLVYCDKIAIRFYFDIAGSVSDYSFTSGSTVYTPARKDGYYYIEVPGILPENLDQPVTLCITDAEGNVLTVSYSPMNYMVRMNEKGSESLKALLKALYNYHLAAKALRTA